MGANFRSHDFSNAQRQLFSQRIAAQLDALDAELNRPSYQQETVTLGAELELYIVDRHFQPAPHNDLVIDKAKIDSLQPELNQYNLECNLQPVDAADDSLTALQQQLDEALKYTNQAASLFDCKALVIGILPTLDKPHLSEDYITNQCRFHTLAKELKKLRGNPFHIDIHGLDVVNFLCRDIALEGANSGFQFHHRVSRDRFANCFNAAQLVTPLVLAIAGNSPIFLGKRLWHETRIALFKQSIDLRHHDATQWRQPARVSYGHGWLRRGIKDCLAESVALHPPILPVTAEFMLDPQPGDFSELIFHHGTVWNWNRGVFQPGENGHVRIEYRSLPAGPSNQDMIANAALLVGLVEGLADDIETYIQRLPFRYAEFNFYRCAQFGLAAKVLWPHHRQTRLKAFRVSDILIDMLPIADRGLSKIGISQNDRAHYLQIIAQRLATQQTGAQWQLDCYKHLLNSHPQHKVLPELCRLYFQGCQSGQPVADWE